MSLTVVVGVNVVVVVLFIYGDNKSNLILSVNCRMEINDVLENLINMNLTCSEQ